MVRQEAVRERAWWWAAAHAGIGAVMGGLGVVLAGRALVPAMFSGSNGVVTWLILVFVVAVSSFGVLDWWFSPLRKISGSVAFGAVTAVVWLVMVVACFVALSASGSAAPSPLEPPLAVMVGGAMAVALAVLLRHRGWARWTGIAVAGAALVMFVAVSCQAQAEDDLAGLQNYFGSTLRPYVSPVEGYGDPALVGLGSTVLAMYLPTGQDPAPVGEVSENIVVTTELFGGSVSDAVCNATMRSSTAAEADECVPTELGWLRSNDSSTELVIEVEDGVLLRVSGGVEVTTEMLEAVITRAKPMDDQAYLAALHRVCNGCLEAGW